MNAQEAEYGLDKIEVLLRQMLALAERAAEDTCTDRQRQTLQKGLDLLRAQINWTADQFKQEGFGEV